MNGLMDFCYTPVLPSPTHPTNSSFSVWHDGDFTPCFEYLVFIIFLHVLFSLASALYAGLKHTVITRRRKPLALTARALVCLCVVVNSLIEFVAAFWIVKGRSYAILLAEVVVVVSWCVHMWCVMVLGSSIKHSGRGPFTLNSMWFVTVAGTAVHLRTIIRWHTNPEAYRYLTDDYGTAYFTLLLQVTTYVHLGLQCLYAVTLLFRVKPVAGHNIKLPKNFSRLLESGSTQYSEEGEDESVRRQLLISSEWKPDGSARYGSIQIPGEDLSKLEASEDGSNPISLLTFWWVQPLMRRGAMGLLRRPEDLLQLPESLRTARVREQFQNSLDRYRHHPGRTYEGSKTDDRGLQSGATPTQVTTSENALDVDVNTESGSGHVSMAMPFSDEATLLTSFTRSVKKGKRSDDRTDPGGRPKPSRHQGHDDMPSQNSRMSLVWALNRAFGCHYYPLGLLKLAADILGFAGPLLLHALVAFMENRTEPMANGYYYALGLFLTTFFMALLNTHFTYQVNKVGLKIRAALITEIYRKALHVNYTSLSEFSTGQVVNYMSTDTDRIVNFCQSFHQFWSLPFQIAVSLYLLYQQVGLAFLTGVGFCILLVPINRWLAVKIGKLSTEMMASKDSRVKMMSEILTGIRVIKFYAWEKNFTKKVLGIRSSELKSLKGRKYLDALCVYFWATTPVLISILTFTTYVLMGNKLTAAKVFTSVALFNILISPLNAFPWVINGLVEAWVSIKRVREFLQLSELDLSQYYITQSQERSAAHPPMQEEEDTGVCDAAIFIRDGCFTWTKEITTDDERGQTGKTSLTSEATGAERETEESTSSPVEWTLADVNLVIKPGQLVGVVGKVGTGKSSLLAAITAEMRRKGGEICVANLEDGFGFAAQEAWIQHATVRENILFGQPFNSEKYSAIVYACALEQDLQVLPAGDCTEVGENGVTLSGGQKARLALARAIYQDKEVYLLDDPLAAVDAHVATHLFTHCITGLLRHKTRILCTHHIRYLHEADIVLVMEGGCITCCGPPNEVLPLVEERLLGEGGRGGEEERAGENMEQQADPGLEQTLPPPTASETQPRQEVEHVLVKEEEKEVGVVAFGVYRAYWSAVGNILAPAILLSLFLMQASRNINDWWLAYWISHTHSGSAAGTNISAYNITPSDMEWRPRINMEWNRDPWTTNTSIHSLSLYSASDNLVFYLGIYGGLAAANSVFTLLRAFLYAYGGIRAATVLHRKLLQSILRAPVSFFDVTPIGRIVNRFSSDLYAIDDSLPFILNILLAQFYGLLGTIAITCYGLPWFTLLLVPLGVLYYHIQKFYRRTSRELKRLSTVTLSPVYAHFSESLVGLCTIRALRASERFIGENEARVEVNQRANFGSYAVAQWLGIRLQMLGVAMVTGVSFIAVLEHHFNSVDPGLVGLAISYALSVTNLLSGVVTSFTETEKQMVSVERAIQYIQGAPKEQNNGTNKPTHNWPSQGVVEFKKAVLVYREDLPPALKEVSFVTRPVEKIGVVGRTGSGKSSLFQALFRMVELSGGSILVDGVDIISLSLEQLRSVLAVIPQDPFLFSGSVRENLDPCQKHSDHELHSVLERCHLRVAVRDLGGLGAEVQEKGRVFSVGQRQLLCLARALLTQAKVICIDEATANVDLHTDSQIQQTIRSEFTDSTVITVAHRIDTVLNSDRILVMEQGQIKEFGSPAQLLDNPDSLFSALFREHCK